MNNFTSGHKKNNQISSISFLTGTKNMAAILITVNIMEMVNVWTGIRQRMK
jgi:translation elongation factor EF-1alpha